MDMTLDSIAKQFSDKDKARELMEHLRWPDGNPIYPHCGAVEKVYRLTPKAGSKTRKGLLKCGACRKQFTVAVGTTYIPQVREVNSEFCRNPVSSLPTARLG